MIFFSENLLPSQHLPDEQSIPDIFVDTTFCPEMDDVMLQSKDYRTQNYNSSCEQVFKMPLWCYEPDTQNKVYQIKLKASICSH